MDRTLFKDLYKIVTAFHHDNISPLGISLNTCEIQQSLLVITTKHMYAYIINLTIPY